MRAAFVGVGRRGLSLGGPLTLREGGYKLLGTAFQAKGTKDGVDLQAGGHWGF